MGCEVRAIGGPGDKRRMAGIRDGSLDIIFDEGISTWIDDAMTNGFEPLDMLLCF